MWNIELSRFIAESLHDHLAEIYWRRYLIAPFQSLGQSLCSLFSCGYILIQLFWLLPKVFVKWSHFCRLEEELFTLLGGPKMSFDRVFRLTISDLDHECRHDLLSPSCWRQSEDSLSWLLRATVSGMNLRNHFLAERRCELVLGTEGALYLLTI